ncbi:MAG: DUF1015 domain-containing protein [Candidatus Omnitrophota bacterium]|nr:MAG: DUF1015 domain-containing protein [Candidatus Omnitrophota bacterium]
MSHIRPFRGVLYNPEKIKDIAEVVTEPYDVINSSQQAAYYKLSPYNIIRLILGRHYPDDNIKSNEYTRAREYLRDWLKRDILRRDGKESIYIYTQTFSHNNKMRTRTGFFVLLKIEDFAKNTVLPHENTKSSAVQDRMKLLEVTGANLSPIFALFSEPEGKISKLLNQEKKAQRPYITIKKDNITHRIWRISQRKKIAAIQRQLLKRQIFIADGHHRYEAALNYKLKMQKKKRAGVSSAPFNYVMAYLVSAKDPGLTILPTHRVIKLAPGFNVDEIISKLKKAFIVYKFSSREELFSYMASEAHSACVFGAYFGKKRFYGLKLKDAKLTRELDVNVLHSVIVEEILNISPFQGDICYTREAEEAIGLVDADKNQAAFFLRPLRVAQVKKTAAAGRKMPHKSTYFYPKALTGLVINKLK